ncbi:hypothetical protein GWI33_001896 [Rhynchophorus ferrugineus]|uniref:Uncharacterized protein n=1 Tax=Rhynchophorus ferrugineus TaxID=354439 RepID=A0A834MG40_RHYFE|nr:hypothetical protein GWI33_001896 [Rhynchophorus ferrugineus]
MSDNLEDSVIEATPVRKKVKKMKYHPKREKKTNDLPVENYPTAQLGQKTCTLSENKNQSDINYVCSDITEPIDRTKSKNLYNHYVFYSIEEILKFTLKSFPVNNWVHLMGVHSLSTDLNCSVLCSTMTVYNKQAEVKLLFSSITTVPKEGEHIIVYGFLNIDSDLPVVYVNFFQVCDINYKIYIKLMLELRSTVPLHNFATQDISNDALSIDQSLLACSRNDFCDRFEGLEETFKDTSISDSQLCLYVDDII